MNIIKKNYLPRSFIIDVIFFMASQLVAGTLMLVFVFISAKLLNKEEFSLFQSLMGLSNIILFFGLPLNIATVHTIAMTEDKDKPAMLGYFLKLSALLGFIAAVFIIVSSPWFKTAFYAKSSFSFFYLALFVLVCSILTSFYGGLQGANRYAFFSLVKMCESAGILILGITFMIFNSVAASAVAGYAASMTLAILFLLTQRDVYSFKATPINDRNKLYLMIRPVAILGILVFISDFPMIIARHKLSIEFSGAFAAIYSLRSATFPFAYAVAVPLYSRYISGEFKPNLLWKSISISVIIGLTAIIICTFWPREIINITFGSEFASASEYLPHYSYAMAIQAVVIVLMFGWLSDTSFPLLYLLIPVAMMISLFFQSDLNIGIIINTQIITLLSLPLFFLLNKLLKSISRKSNKL